MAFPVGSKWSYLSHGVGQVSSVSDGGVKLWFPMSRCYITVADTSLLIPPLDETRAELVLEVLRSDPGPALAAAAWINRIRGYKQKLQSGCVEEVAEVVRDLAAKKKMTWGEKQLFSDAFAMLVQQLREVYPEATEKRIRDAYSSRG